MKNPYVSGRAVAWRNLMVSGINAGLEAKLFGLEAGANFWSSTGADLHHYDFTGPDGTKCAAAVRDGGWDELRIFVAYSPSADCTNSLGIMFTGQRAGAAVANGWLERRDGRYLQSAPSEIACRKGLSEIIATWQVEPVGYVDRGKFRM